MLWRKWNRGLACLAYIKMAYALSGTKINCSRIMVFFFQNTFIILSCAVEECLNILKEKADWPNITNIMEPLIHTNTCYMLLRTDLLYVVHVAAWLSITSGFVMVNF